LGIPTVKDRVVQMAAVLVLEPIFETDPQPEQYAYRPHRGALDAVRHVHKLLVTGHGRWWTRTWAATSTAFPTKLKLTVNAAKTHVRRLPQETFDFLGYTFGRCYSPKTGRSYIGTKPAKKRVARLCAAISELTDRRGTSRDTGEVVTQLNRMMTGWANYFCLGPVSCAYHAVDQHARSRLRQWLRKKHKMQERGTSQFPDAYLHQRLGLIHLGPRTAHFPWAGTWRLLREPDAGNPPVRFDERDVETEQGTAREAPANERAGQRIGHA
jgi:hypothetical protein